MSSDSARSPSSGAITRSADSNAVGDDRLAATQLAEHVRVLRALAGVHERDLSGSTGAAEDAARRERAPGGRRVAVERTQRQRGLLRELGRVAVVDRDPLGRAQVRLVGSAARGRLAAAGRLGHRAQAGGQATAVGVRRPRARRAAGAFASASATASAYAGAPVPGAAARVRADRVPTSRPRCVRCSQAAGDVLLEHDVEVRATEAERAHAGDPRAVGGDAPNRAARC